MSKNQEDTGQTSALPVGASATITPLRKPVKCPNCNNWSARSTYPFCCKRCADADMGRWFNGTYTIDL